MLAIGAAHLPRCVVLAACAVAFLAPDAVAALGHEATRHGPGADRLAVESVMPAIEDFPVGWTVGRLPADTKQIRSRITACRSFARERATFFEQPHSRALFLQKNNGASVAIEVARFKSAKGAKSFMLVASDPKTRRCQRKTARSTGRGELLKRALDPARYSIQVVLEKDTSLGGSNAANFIGLLSISGPDVEENRVFAVALARFGRGVVAFWADFDQGDDEASQVFTNVVTSPVVERMIEIDDLTVYAPNPETSTLPPTTVTSPPTTVASPATTAASALSNRELDVYNIAYDTCAPYTLAQLAKSYNTNPNYDDISAALARGYQRWAQALAYKGCADAILKQPKRYG